MLQESVIFTECEVFIFILCEEITPGETHFLLRSILYVFLATLKNDHIFLCPRN